MANESDETAESVVRFWLGEPGEAPLARAGRWWTKDEGFDREVRERFLTTLEKGVAGGLEGWRGTARGRLGLVILFDQLSRNMFRGTARSFAQDGLAREVAAEALASGDAEVLTPVETSFLFMPFMHDENLASQRRCLEGFRKLRDAATDDKLRENFESSFKFAGLHLGIIERFGRFPHRNEILGRPSTEAERAFLEQPGSSF